MAALADAGEPGDLRIPGDQQRHHASGSRAILHPRRVPGKGQRLVRGDDLGHEQHFCFIDRRYGGGHGSQDLHDPVRRADPCRVLGHHRTAQEGNLPDL